MKLVVLDGESIMQNDLDWSALEQFGTVEAYRGTAPQEVIERLRGADVCLTSKVFITGEIMDQLPELKLICELATGYNNIDVEAAKERGIAVCYIPAYATDAVAQHTFALILELTNRVGLYDMSVKDGDWSRSSAFCYMLEPFILLKGRSLGIVGYGTIGKRVAEIAQAFGMEINIYSRDREACMKSDIISLHCPQTEENAGMINKDFIAQMKDGAMLINTARGRLVNEADLAEALKSGKLAGAALDVLWNEPPEEDHPLIPLKNCVLTPHIAWMPKEMRLAIIKVTEDNVRSYLEGGTLNRVDR